MSNTLLSEFRLIGDSGDPWGETMGWLFGIAEVFCLRFGETLPDFRPSPAHPDEESIREQHPDSHILGLVDDGIVAEDDLRYAYAILSRYAEWLKPAGRDY